MMRIRVTGEIAAPAAEVWEILVDTRRWPEWGPSIRRVECDPPRIAAGIRGRVLTVAGLWLPFEITRCEEGRSWDWKVAGVAATGHEVAPLAPGSCRVTFTVPLLAAPYVVVVRAALERLRAIVGSGG